VLRRRAPLQGERIWHSSQLGLDSEHVVQESNERYRRLVEMSPDGIFIHQDGLIVFLNPAALRLFGATTPAQVLGKSVYEIYHPDSHALIRERIRRLLQGQTAPLVDEKIVRLDGPVVDVEVTSTLLEQEGRAIQVIVRDITQRKQTERALRESEERLTLAFAGAQEGVWDWNLETGDVVYSTRGKEMLGYQDHEVEPHLSAWERLLHPDDKARAYELNETVVRGGRTTYEGEFRLRHKDGHFVHVLSRGCPIRLEPGGPVVRIVGTHFDLTERKRAEAALRESEERLTLAFAGAREGVWDWNLVTGAVVYSTQWKHMLGYSEEEIEPHVSAWERLVHPDDRQRAHDVNERVARGERTYEGEFRLRHKAGHYVHVLSRGLPVRREPGGPVVRIVGTHFDLTERKQADAERARTELLARLVFAQEDERRRIAREMHDQFGEQLTALGRGIGGLKQACGGHPELQERIEALEVVAQQLDRDVEHLVWKLRPTALDDLGLRAALANYINDWSKRVQIAAELHTSGLLDDRLASETETTLYRIVQEALTNVAKHSNASKVDVLLERRSDHVVLIVEDDGVGFDFDDAGKRGDGFGLLGMQERAALVGANLQIESTPGEGTTILVRMAVGSPAGQSAHD
jgi:PAS domain S-box-containing protein